MTLPEIDKNNNFNFLRLLFSFIVALAHATGVPGYTYEIERILDPGLAVYGFFIISGFLFLFLIYICGIIFFKVHEYYEKTAPGSTAAGFAHQLPAYIHYFITGVFLLLNYSFIQKYMKYIIIPAIILFALHYVTGTAYFLALSLGIIIIFIAFNFHILNGIGKNGDYSYGVYIYHAPLIQILALSGYYRLNKNLTVLITCGIVFSISYLSWHFLEKGILKRS